MPIALPRKFAVIMIWHAVPFDEAKLAFHVNLRVRIREIHCLREWRVPTTWSWSSPCPGSSTLPFLSDEPNDSR